MKAANVCVITAYNTYCQSEASYFISCQHVGVWLYIVLKLPRGYANALALSSSLLFGQILHSLVLEGVWVGEQPSLVKCDNVCCRMLCLKERIECNQWF